MRGFSLKKESQGVKDFLTGGYQPWLPCELVLIESNVRLEIGELCELFDKAGYNRSRASLSKKRGIIARKLLKLSEEKRMAGPKPDEFDVETGEPVRKLSDAEIDQARGRSQSDVKQPLVERKEPVCFDFIIALALLKAGVRVSRTGWNGAGMWIGMQEPDENSKMTLPYIYMSTAQGDLVPWLASQTDLLANDWCRFNG